MSVKPVEQENGVVEFSLLPRVASNLSSTARGRSRQMFLSLAAFRNVKR
jgi:hypothetical protein